MVADGVGVGDAPPVRAIERTAYCRTLLPPKHLSDLLGVPTGKMDDNVCTAPLDELLPHKEALEVVLEGSVGRIFGMEYDLLLYDVTSTYFEGQARGESAGETRLFPRHRAGLQTGLHRPGGLTVRVAAGLRSLRREIAWIHTLEEVADDGSPLRPGGRISAGSRHGLGR